MGFSYSPLIPHRTDACNDAFGVSLPLPTRRASGSDYPSGVNRTDQTRRVRKLAALMWVLGLGVRGSADPSSATAVISAAGATCARERYLGRLRRELSRLTVWRDGPEQAALVVRRQHAKTARVLEMDGVE